MSHLSSPSLLETPPGLCSKLTTVLYTFHCVATSSSTNIVNFVDDTVLVDLISNDKTSCLKEIKNLEIWCQDNNLLLNICKTKELMVDFWTKQKMTYQPLTINGPQWRAWTVSRCSHNPGSVMILSHQQSVEEGPTASLPSQTLKGF